MKFFMYLFYPVIALVALMDYGNGKTFKQNFDAISASKMKVEGPNE